MERKKLPHQLELSTNLLKVYLNNFPDSNLKALYFQILNNQQLDVSLLEAWIIETIEFYNININSQYTEQDIYFKKLYIYNNEFHESKQRNSPEKDRGISRSNSSESIVSFTQEAITETNDAFYELYWPLGLLLIAYKTYNKVNLNTTKVLNSNVLTVLLDTAPSKFLQAISQNNFLNYPIENYTDLVDTFAAFKYLNHEMSVNFSNFFINGYIQPFHMKAEVLMLYYNNQIKYNKTYIPENNIKYFFALSKINESLSTQYPLQNSVNMFVVYLKHQNISSDFVEKFMPVYRNDQYYILQGLYHRIYDYSSFKILPLNFEFYNFNDFYLFLNEVIGWFIVFGDLIYYSFQSKNSIIILESNKIAIENIVIWEDHKELKHCIEV